MTRGLRIAPGVFLLAAELAALLAAVWFFEIEATRGFVHLFELVAVAGVVHALLPRRWRPWFLLLVTALAVLLLLGPGNGAWLLGLVLALWGLCQLPGPTWVRVVALGAAGVLGALCRLDVLSNTVPMPVWPIVASLFMFRAILYVYETSEESEHAPLVQRFLYFFMLPNVYFPFFPIVDWGAFRRGYYSAPDQEVHHVGTRWILQGILHSLAYRVIYYNFVVEPASVRDMTRLFQFLVTNYLLYLRVSAQFHLSIGILGVFGYQLPRTHNLYYLSTGFTDLWNRINVYWKDFMVKLFYYPALIRLRGLGVTTSMVLATLWVFVCTWALHVYQRFWLTGRFQAPVTEAIFWVVVGVCVVANLLWRARRPKGILSGAGGGGALLGVRAAGMFLVMAALWSLLTASGFKDWRAVWDLGTPVSWGEMPRLAGLFGLMVGVAVASRRVFLALGRWPAFGTVAAAVALCVSGAALSLGALGADSSGVLATLRSNRLNALDNNRLVAGYYEDLVNINQATSLWDLRVNKPRDWKNLGELGVMRPGKELVNELMPSVRVKYMGVTIQTNRWGMRDQDYDLQKPAGTYRIALIGGSEVFGGGLEEQETLDRLLDKRLNGETSEANRSRYEVMNFGCPGYFPLARLIALETKVLRFKPDLVLYVAHTNELDGLADDVASWHQLRPEVLDQHLGAGLAGAELQPRMARPLVRRKIQPLLPQLLEAVYKRLATAARGAGAGLVWVYWPSTAERNDATAWSEWSRAGHEAALRAARDSGFGIIDLRAAFDGYTVDDVRLAPWDYHCNALAQHLLADRLYPQLRKGIDAVWLREASR